VVLIDVPYVDDLIIYSSDFKSHLSHLMSLFEKFKQTDIMIAFNNCEFAKSEIDFLGFRVTTEGIKPLESRVNDLQKVTAPKDHKGVLKMLHP